MVSFFYMKMPNQGYSIIGMKITYLWVLSEKRGKSGLVRGRDDERFHIKRFQHHDLGTRAGHVIKEHWKERAAGEGPWCQAWPRTGFGCCAWQSWGCPASPGGTREFRGRSWTGPRSSLPAAASHTSEQTGTQAPECTRSWFLAPAHRWVTPSVSPQCRCWPFSPDSGNPVH